jgi:hypothetical protein
VASYNILRALTTYKAVLLPWNGECNWKVSRNVGVSGFHRGRSAPAADLRQAAPLRTLRATFLLFQEQRLADLIAANERLGGAELSEDVEDFAILKNARVNR